MNIRINYHDHLKLPKEIRESAYFLNGNRIFKEKDKKADLTKFNYINFFIGANNSGKSRFLRGLFKLEEKNFEIYNSLTSISDDLISYQKYADYLLGYPISNLMNIYYGVKSLIEFENFKDKKNFNELFENHNFKEKGHEKIMIDIEKKIENIKRIGFVGKQKDYINNAELLLEYSNKIRENLIYHKQEVQSEKIYLPVLRYANVNNHLSKEAYKNTIKENYDIDEYVFTGLDLYESIRKLQGEVSRNRIKKKKFEEFLSKTFFNQAPVEITASTNESNKIYFQIQEDEKYLYDLGDGLQTIIILMYPLFNAKDNQWIFIDEPECHLHPGFQ